MDHRGKRKYVTSRCLTMDGAICGAAAQILDNPLISKRLSSSGANFASSEASKFVRGEAE